MKSPQDVYVMIGDQAYLNRLLLYSLRAFLERFDRAAAGEILGMLRLATTFSIPALPSKTAMRRPIERVYQLQQQ